VRIAEVDLEPVVVASRLAAVGALGGVEHPLGGRYVGQRRGSQEVVFG
jgi:hypothetical protein